MKLSNTEICITVIIILLFFLILYQSSNQCNKDNFDKEKRAAEIIDKVGQGNISYNKFKDSVPNGDAYEYGIVKKLANQGNLNFNTLQQSL